MENRYKELDKLEKYLKENGYIYERKDSEQPAIGLNTHQIIIYIGGERAWDVICQVGSYGYEKGLLEVQGFALLGHDDVEGDLTADQIIAELEKAEAIETLEKMRAGYKMLIEQDVKAGKIIGRDFNGEWEAKEAPTESYKKSIKALQIAIDTIRKDQGRNRGMLKRLEELREKYPNGIRVPSFRANPSENE